MAKGTEDTGEHVEEIDGEHDVANYRAKLTIATIGGSPERAKTEKGRVHVAQIFGIATGTKEVPNPMDETKPFTAIVGNFEAVNMHDGTIHRSGVLYLPGGLHEMVTGMLDELKDNKESKFDKPQVQFALAIDATPADNPAGYQYVGNSLLPPAKADPLAMLRNRAHKLLPPP